MAIGLVKKCYINTAFYLAYYVLLYCAVVIVNRTKRSEIITLYTRKHLWEFKEFISANIHLIHSHTFTNLAETVGIKTNITEISHYN